MAYTPSTLTIVSWSSPLTIQPYDLISGLDDAVNSIVSSHGGSLRNFMNTELAKIPTYLSAELTSVYNETNASAVAAAASAVTAADTVAPFTSHLTDTANPHTVTKAQVGLGNCDNTTDLLKPISTATQSVLDLKASIANMELKAPLASPTFTGTVKVEDANVTAYGKNYIINGGFDRWDYATSQTLDGYGSANRWFLYKDSGTLSLTRYASNTSFFKSKYYATFNAVAAVGAVAIQKVEGLKKFAGKIVTLSYIRALESGTQTTPIPVLYLNFGTGGTPTSGFGATLLSSNIVTGGLCTATYQIPALNTYTFGTTDTSDHLEVIFNMSGTHVTSIGLVQLEEGSVATPWTPYNGEFGGEVQACQRYYEPSQINTVFYGTASMGWQQSATHKTKKRVSPSVTITTPTGHVNIGTITAVANSDVVIFAGTVIASGNVAINTLYTASAEL